jgi:hypothetical protein
MGSLVPYPKMRRSDPALTRSGLALDPALGQQAPHARELAEVGGDQREA